MKPRAPVVCDLLVAETKIDAWPLIVDINDTNSEKNPKYLIRETSLFDAVSAWN